MIKAASALLVFVNMVVVPIDGGAPTVPLPAHPIVSATCTGDGTMFAFPGFAQKYKGREEYTVEAGITCVNTDAAVPPGHTPSVGHTYFDYFSSSRSCVPQAGFIPSDFAKIWWNDGTTTTFDLPMAFNAVQAANTTTISFQGTVAAPIGGTYEYTSPSTGAAVLSKSLRKSQLGGNCPVLSPKLTVFPAISFRFNISPATQYVVSLGDSSVSGEGGRWAGNTNVDYSNPLPCGDGSFAYNLTDVCDNAYYDNATHTAEVDTFCHRSKSAEIAIGGQLSSFNFACSGAQTATVPDQLADNTTVIKPGLDNPNLGGVSQTWKLEVFASTHSVHAVVVRIGVNNFNFADIVALCVKHWEFPLVYPGVCSSDSDAYGNFSDARVSQVEGEIASALVNVETAMTNDGYPLSSFRMIVQLYPSVVPDAVQYGSVGRQGTYGCGFYDADTEWMNQTALFKLNSAETQAANDLVAQGYTNVALLDTSLALQGHRLCESGTELLENSPYAPGTDPAAASVLEWVAQVRINAKPEPYLPDPYQQQEGFHPNYWGQLAQRNCVRQAYEQLTPGHTMVCRPGTGTNDLQEPNMLTYELGGLTFSEQASSL